MDDLIVATAPSDACDISRNLMRQCIYCRADKPDTDFTLEHVIPQFLGGAYAPDYLKTRDVCGQCNNNLGLFVDAGFEKNWIVSNYLRGVSASFFDPATPVGLPLVCMGFSDLVPPDMPEGYVCELWLGPLGEQVYWVRPHDDRLYWYVGGNPRTMKKVESRAYFMFSIRSQKNPTISWLTFENAFEGQRVRKLMCTQVDGAEPSAIGFAAPDGLDRRRIEYFNAQCSTGAVRRGRVSFYTRFDSRFLAKLAIGLSHCLFGSKIHGTCYDSELQKLLWQKAGDEDPLVKSTSMLSAEANPVFNRLVGQPEAVSVVLISTPEGVTANLNIGTKLNWTILIASRSTLDEADFSRIGDGLIVLLFRPLQKGFFYSLPRYLAHKTGDAPLQELLDISALHEKHADYFKSL